MEEGRISRVSSAARFYPMRLRPGEDPVLSCAIAWGIVKVMPQKAREYFPEACPVGDILGAFGGSPHDPRKKIIRTSRRREHGSVRWSRSGA